MATEAQKKAISKYDQKFKRIVIRVPLGKDKEIEAFAKAKGKSVNAYITELIKKDMESGG